MKTILYIDDNEGDQFIVEYAIKAHDSSLEMIQAFDGQEGLEILQKMEQPPLLILLDINMPRMSGLDFLEEVSLRPDLNTADLSVAMLTSSDSTKDIDQCMSYPFVKKYITKPLTQEILVELLDN